MNDESAYLPDPAEWAAGARDFTSRILASIGERTDLMRTDPGTAIRVLDRELADAGLLADATAMPDDERWRLHSLLIAAVGEFLVNAHGARWAWLTDPTSPLDGRWVITGFPHPTGAPTSPVDVPGICNEALSFSPIRLIDLANQAERLSGMRVFGP